MSDSCCDPAAIQLDRRRRVLWTVLAINATMFVVELMAGVLAGSVALQADSLDMLGDTLVYAFSLAVVGGTVAARARAAQLKGAIMLLFGAGVLAQIVLKIVRGVPPDPLIVTGVGIAALCANVACLGLLYRHRRDDINMRSTWVCSRNDIIANSGVLVSAAGVATFAAIWPDVVVSLGIVTLFLFSATNVLRAAASELRNSCGSLDLCSNGTCAATACRCAAG